MTAAYSPNVLVLILVSWCLGAGFTRTFSIEVKNGRNTGTPFLYLLLVMICLVSGWVFVIWELAEWLFRSTEKP